jgi:hypothetical protein
VRARAEMQCRERTHENSLKVKVCSVLEGFCIPISISAAQIGSNLDPRSYRIVSYRVEVVRELGRCSVPKRKVRVAHVSKRPLVSACLGQRLSVTKVGKRELGPGLAVSHQPSCPLSLSLSLFLLALASGEPVTAASLGYEAELPRRTVSQVLLAARVCCRTAGARGEGKQKKGSRLVQRFVL